MSQTNDGGHIFWSCRTKRGHNVTCDSVNYTDLQIREIFCKVMHTKSFDEDFFNAKVEKLMIQKSGSIDFYMKDGMVKTFETLKLRINIHENTDTDEFIGKVKCAVCGNTYHKYSCKGRFHYWACSGRWKVRTDCNAGNISDCNLRTVSAYIMGAEEFDPVAFEQQVKEILVLEDGSMTFHFYDGRDRTWERM